MQFHETKDTLRLCVILAQDFLSGVKMKKLVHQLCHSGFKLPSAKHLKFFISYDDTLRQKIENFRYST